MDTGLKHKVVLVTGASGGIGRALSAVFAAEGAQLVLLGHSHVDELRGRARSLGERALVLAADVRDAAQVDAAFDAALERFGRVDVCAANAGAYPQASQPLVSMAPGQLADTLAVNLLGAAHTARSFLRALENTGPHVSGDGAALAFTGSTAGLFGEAGHADYAMAKAGLVGLVKTLKNEITAIDPAGRVNLVQPGWTVTEMARPALEDPSAVTGVVRTMALRQLARADDIARAVLVLASPVLSRHTTGEVLTVAGGMEGRTLWERELLDAAEIRARS